MTTRDVINQFSKVSIFTENRFVGCQSGYRVSICDGLEMNCWYVELSEKEGNGKVTDSGSVFKSLYPTLNEIVMFAKNQIDKKIENRAILKKQENKKNQNERKNNRNH